VIETYKLQC